MKFVTYLHLGPSKKKKTHRPKEIGNEIQNSLNSLRDSHFLSTSILAAAAAKSLQSCLTLCDPIDGSPPGSSVPRILQARPGVGCHFLLQCMKVKVKSLSCV